MLVGKPTKEGFGGILPEATLFAANMFEINDRGKTIGNAMGLLKSLDWLANKKPHAINLSVAGNNNKVIRLAFKKAREYKLIMIAAAGNWGVEKPAYPAAFKDVLAVTAVADKMKIYRKANRGDYIDFAAPGVRLWTAVPGGGKYQTGTSFASPISPHWPDWPSPTASRPTPDRCGSYSRKCRRSRRSGQRQDLRLRLRTPEAKVRHITLSNVT